MTELLSGYIPQPNFPDEDLSEDNADMLALMLANDQVCNELHYRTEQYSELSRFFHELVTPGYLKLYDAKEQRYAIDRGVRTFEAIKGFVKIPLHEATRAQAVVASLRPVALDRIGLGDQVDYFTKKMPRTAEVIKEATSRPLRHVAPYALIGAAISWSFEKKLRYRHST